MAEITILSEQELRKFIKLDENAINCVEQAFKTLSSGRAVMPPVLRLDIEEYNGEVDVKTAYMPGMDCFAIKVSPGFFDNPKRGLPSLNGMMVLLNAKTGIPEALLLDNGYLTAVRTAAAGAVAAKWLSRKNSTTAAIMGAGEQGRLQLKALKLVRDIKTASIWARSIEKAQLAAAELSEDLGIKITAYSDAEKAVKGADIIVTATPATAPVFFKEMLEPGQHVTAMGSDAGHKNEIDPKAIAATDIYAADSLSQTEILGELHHALEAGTIKSEQNLCELGAIISGTAAGRCSSESITIADLTGTGVQDTAIANLALNRARTLGTGTQFNA
ncbi:ectoine utilization protein EutC [Maridesulfovibrio bastinii]|uniref:ectoine utilization protein EutC n=1 Tax=Maridesulfovibrio bastinii TaxID=47157 RepID=UPI0003FDE1D3|nr:ectoine utilization protein EutC [Maridesulfovibrio bastinii]